MFMKKRLALALIVFSTASMSAQAKHIPQDATIYIEATDFGKALSAAILKKHVPALITTDRQKASYFLESVSEAKTEGTGERITKVIVLGMWAGSGKTFDATVTITDADGSVVFAYNSKKSNFQSAAEGVAKNLKKHIEEP
jgi:hypothetical protein